MNKLVVLALGAGMAFSTVACDQDRQQANESSIDRVAEESREAAEAAGDAIKEGAEDFSNWASDRMAKIDKEFDEVRPKIKESTSDMKEEWNHRMDELEVKRQQWQKDFEEFKNNMADKTKDEREQIRESLKNGLDAIGEEIDQLKDKLSS